MIGYIIAIIVLYYGIKKLIIYCKIKKLVWTSKYLRSPYLKNISQKIDEFMLDIEVVKKDYITNSIKAEIIKKYECLLYEDYIKKEKINEAKEFKRIYENLDDLVKEWNEEYIENELIEKDKLFSNIDGKCLDEQQRKAVIVDEDNNLIVAGAGSGKTLTISAKVKYLIEYKNVISNEILLISFTKKASQEINERINKKLGIKVKSTTFHKLGLDIISEYEDKKPDIADDLLDKTIEYYFKNNIYNDSKTLNNIITFLGYYINIPKNIEYFNNIGDYYKYCKSLDLVTLRDKSNIENTNKIEIEQLKKERKTIKGEKVKSLEEVIIANFLFLNGVKYIYENKYKYETGDRFRKQYRPDFYLPEYDIYIEHFGVNRQNKTPQYSEIEGIKYNEDMEWKKELHKKYNTTLIETYSYYQQEGILLKKLRDKLAFHGVNLKEIDKIEVYKSIFENKRDRSFEELRKLISTFIILFKSNGYGLSDFTVLSKEVRKIKDKFIRERIEILLSIIKPIYIEYEDRLKKNNKIDFNDMINKSTEIVKRGDINLNYKYIIIDEYQDISNSRFNLIKEIKNKTNAKLVCVGDDWQSIYRFTGSDIGLFTNFMEYIGYYELLKIENTYRNSQQLINVASNFIMKNKNQISKNLKSDKTNYNPIQIVTYKENALLAFERCIENIITKFGVNAEITVIGRNNYDKNILLKEKTQGQYWVQKVGDNEIIKSKKYPGLKMNFLTVHRSKGLEGDNVIVLNMENKTTGFPNQISDDPILNLVLTKPESYDYAEERRLFYVAITRTRNSTYLISSAYNMSIFCEEIIKDFKLKTECVDGKKDENVIECPKCIKGHLLHRKDEAKGYSFVGCSNYPVCNFSSKHIEILENTIRCKSCGGFMVEREYAGEKFLGCTNYPYCRNTEQISIEYMKKINKKQQSRCYEGNDAHYYYEEDIAFNYTDIIYDMDTEDDFYGEEYEEYSKQEGIKITKNVSLYIKENEKYNYYTTCIIDTEVSVGDIMLDDNRYLKVDKYYKNEIYTHEVEINFSHNSYNKVLTLYLNDNFFKKYLTNKIYNVDDLFKYEGQIYKIVEIFKDTIFMELLNIEYDYLQMNNSRLLSEESEGHYINKLITQLLEFKEVKCEYQSQRLWLDGFVNYIMDNEIINIYSKDELASIVVYDKVFKNEWLLSSISDIKLSDIKNYRIEISFIEDNLRASMKRFEM